MKNDLLDDHLIDIKPEYDFKIGLAALWSIPWLIGNFFRLMHWPFAGALIIFGSAALMAYSLSGFVTFKGRSLANNVSVIISLFYIGQYVFSVFQYGRSLDFLWVYGIITLLFLAIHLAVKKKRYGFY